MVHPLRALREQRGLTQQALANAVGLSRQSLNAVEAGRTVPSVAVALRLARTLETNVEVLFGEGASQQVQAELASHSRSGARVVLGWLGERWVAHCSFGPGLAADGFLQATARKGRALVELSRAPDDLRQNVLLAGCAPGLANLSDRLNGGNGPGRFRWLMRSNGAALRALSANQVHLAGVHLPMGPPSEIAKTVARHLPTSQAEVYALSTWEAGLVMAKGNPHRIRDVAALANPKIRVALREVGSGARHQLDRLLKKCGADPSALVSHAVPVTTHMEVAYAVALGAADVGFAIRAAALELGLDFIPLVKERCDLIVPAPLTEDPRCRRLLDMLSNCSFQRELSALGYEAELCGSKIAHAVSA